MTRHKRPTFGDLARRIRAFFTAPVLPQAALALRSREIVLVQARRARERLLVRRVAIEPLAEGVLEPSFEGKNVKVREPLLRALQRALERAGLRHVRRWAVALPSATCRLFLLEMEEVPRAREELASMIAWKIERLIGVSATELTIAAERLAESPPSDRAAASRGARFLVVAARSEVLAAYEDLLQDAGLRPGLLLPNNLAESRWMATLPSGQDALLVSREGNWMTFLFTRDREPLSVRTLLCEPEAIRDEIHRTLVYYQDRLSRPRGESLSPDEPPPVPPLPEKESARSVEGGLRTIVVIQHDADEGGMSPTPSRSPLAQEVEAVSHTLFPSSSRPELYSLNEQFLDSEPEWRLSHLAAPLGMLVAPR